MYVHERQGGHLGRALCLQHRDVLGVGQGFRLHLVSLTARLYQSHRGQLHVVGGEGQLHGHHIHRRGWLMMRLMWLMVWMQGLWLLI